MGTLVAFSCVNAKPLLAIVLVIETFSPVHPGSGCHHAGLGNTWRSRGGCSDSPIVPLHWPGWLRLMGIKVQPYLKGQEVPLL